jgi:phosphonate transport system ATP-binding protein
MASASFVLEKVTVRYGSATALREVDLKIAPGERVGLIGPSGGGKTTLLRVLQGMVRISAGRALACGVAWNDCGAREVQALRARLAFIHQSLALVPTLRVAQNVILGRAGRRSLFGSVRDVLAPAAADIAVISQLLSRVGIAEKLHHRTDQLSGGQQQRVAVARALFQKPDALLADEPVSSIDPARARALVALLTRLSVEDGLTLVMSLHQYDLARASFPRLIGLREGRIVFDGPPEALTVERYEALYAMDDPAA